jgi:nucleoid-associated protein YgaU
MRNRRASLVLLICLATSGLGVTTAAAGPSGDPACAFDGSGCATTTHVVRQGECLWGIARATLRARHRPTDNAHVKRMANAIYADNRKVIGSDPSRIKPGQRLSIRHPDYAS